MRSRRNARGSEMASLLEHALANLAVAAVLAVVAGMVGLWGRRPAITHALWLLVLLKLITPPLFSLELPWPAPTLASETPIESEKSDVIAELPALLPEPNAEIVPLTEVIQVP